MEKYFAVCTPGLEPITALELDLLGLLGSPSASQSENFQKRRARYEWGGIEFQGSLHDLFRANLYLRTASRVLVRLGAFYASAFPELRRKARRLLWANC